VHFLGGESEGERGKKLVVVQHSRTVGEGLRLVLSAMLYPLSSQVHVWVLGREGKGKGKGKGKGRWIGLDGIGLDWTGLDWTGLAGEGGVGLISGSISQSVGAKGKGREGIGLGDG